MNEQIHQIAMKRKIAITEEYFKKYHCSMKSGYGRGTLYIGKDQLCFKYIHLMKTKFLVLKLKDMRDITKVSSKTIEIIDYTGRCLVIQTHKKQEEIFSEIVKQWNSVSGLKSLKSVNNTINFSLSEKSEEFNPIEEQKFVTILSKKVKGNSSQIAQNVFFELNTLCLVKSFLPWNFILVFYLRPLRPLLVTSIS